MTTFAEYLVRKDIQREEEKEHRKRTNGLPTDKYIAKINKKRNLKKYNSIFYPRNNKSK